MGLFSSITLSVIEMFSEHWQTSGYEGFANLEPSPGNFDVNLGLYANCFSACVNNSKGSVRKIREDPGSTSYALIFLHSDHYFHLIATISVNLYSVLLCRACIHSRLC